MVKVNETDALVELLDTNSAVVRNLPHYGGTDLTIPSSPLQGRVRVSKEGFETVSKDFALPAGGSTPIDVQLSRTPPPASAVVTSNSAKSSTAGQWDLPADAPPPAIAPFDAAQAKEHQEAWAKYLNVPVEMTNSIGMKLVLIPPGEFDMGSTQERWTDCSPKRNNARSRSGTSITAREAPQHRVRITRPFCLGACEVTVGQFRQFVADTGYLTEGETGRKGLDIGIDALGSGVQKPEWTWRQPGFEQSDDDPVVHVSWNDAVAFCEWLSRKEGTTYRLPTEAEWEYACRAGSTTKWVFGNEEKWNFGNGQAGLGLDQFAWYFFDLKGLGTHQVGGKKPNAFGLYDMHGNVWEWSQDSLGSEDYYRVSPTDDPPGPAAGTVRVYRGGGCKEGPSPCRSAVRRAGPASTRDCALGFRVAGVLPGK